MQAEYNLDNTSTCISAVTHRQLDHRQPGSRLGLSTLGQAVADGRIRVIFKSATQPVAVSKETSAGGCFQQGSGGRFVKKAEKKRARPTHHSKPERQATSTDRYTPAYNEQPTAGTKLFRPKVNMADLKRSNTLLETSLKRERAKCAQLQVDVVDQPKRTLSEPEQIVQYSTRPNKKQQVAMAECRRERDSFKNKLQRVVNTNASFAKRHEDQIAQLQYEHSAEVAELKQDARDTAAIAEEAVREKDVEVAQHKASLLRCRRGWQTAATKGSRLQAKLQSTVVDFEGKAAGVKRRNKGDVKGLLSELHALVVSTTSERNRSKSQQVKLEVALQKITMELASSQSELDSKGQPIKTMQNGRDFSDEIVLLTWELMAMGVSANIVGDVEALCCEHLAHRKLERKPSKSTAARWGLQSKDISLHHLGELLCKNAERGIGFATDTTTVRSAERAANNFDLRFEDGSVHTLRGPVIELASHTADEQMTHNVQHVLSDTRRVLELAGAVDNWHRVSVVYFVRVMGDHVNESLWDRVEGAKLVELDELIRAEATSPEVAAQLRKLSRNKCSKHKLAKLSRDACAAFGLIQDKSAAVFSNMVPKSGRTYESLGYKITEVVAWQFSCDISVANPHGHAQDFQDWQDLMQQDSLAIFNITKNRHYRHEKGARKVLLHVLHILQYLSDVRDGRDPKEHPNKFTRLGNADSRIWTALHLVYKDRHKMETYCQLAAMEMLDALFFSPALCMICAPSTDVVNVGANWRAAHDWLTDAVSSKTDAELMAGGRAHRCFPGYHKKDKTQAQQKTVDELEFKTPVISLLTHECFDEQFKKRVMVYFRAAAKAMAKGILDIAQEYLPAEYKGIKDENGKHAVGKDGQMFNPSPIVKQQLLGFTCENDYCEAQLGDERQSLLKAAGKISVTTVAGLNMMKHNNVVDDIRSGARSFVYNINPLTATPIF